MTIFRSSIAMLGLKVAGCNQPDVDSCEQFVKLGLKAPSTFRAMQVTMRDEKVTWAQHLREEPNDRNVEIFKRAYELGKFRRIVTLEYEVSNAFGVPIRSSEQCAFDLRDGKVAPRNSLMNSVKIADAQRSFRQLNSADALPNGVRLDMAEPAYPCCE